jgi:hypothetical protein
VNWYPWGDEALLKAKEESKPILVSIGYSACHWCHVMEKESFENEATAAIMNEHFINIKIDREERPDLDHIYMDAVQAMTGSGGWPLNVFLTSDCKPFFGGTYFPPVKAYNRNSWKDVLLNIANAYSEKHHEVETQAENLTNHLKNANIFGNSNAGKLNKENFFTEENIYLIAQNILKQADKEWGGFGNAPKFPQVFSIQYLLRHFHFTKDEESLTQALLSLDKMIYGGIYDQIGGGFARYSTDSKWIAPHFEKMLYDNALLVGVLSEAYQLTHKNLYKETIEQTLEFVDREMRHAEGGFYSALDADSEGVEGKFYTWTNEEIDKILEENASLYAEYYSILQEGNWEHTNILWVQKPLNIFIKEQGLAEENFNQFIKRCNKKLLLERNKRVRPSLDDKIILGWNALMITAYCKAYAATSNEKYKQAAIDATYFLSTKLKHDHEGWFHTYKDGVTKISAFLDDYAYLIQALIHLQEITGNQNYLLQAKEVTNYVNDNFSESGGLFYFTHQNQSDVIIRKKEVYDGATPSGNAIMALNLQYLGIIFNDNAWINQSTLNLKAFENAILNHPTSFGVWASLAQQNCYGINELVITGKKITQTLSVVLHAFIPNKVLQSTNIEKNNFPLLQNKPIKEENTFYLCKNYNCTKPLHNVNEFLAIM